ncbi:hypothetical protein AMJ87_09220 [candidate division WOR_3 bacterium SM23_60]|uniref:DUF2229 domain-containing protein n=1 Tax=candidate division WOR_3 bacterium SM23_60 TaxID=1703780 RepID=A0A0S8GCK1_UNCW3|nr:MAG: hypothetical protein AMJ87_09220 [candidate division WOR_3 bacterium SM23_60]
MKVGFQHMGTVNIALKTFIENLGYEVALGPKPTARTLNIGVKYSPEMVCLPFKITLGDMFGALENGAEMLLFIGSGDWSCRYGYYGRIQCSILQKLGYEFKTLFIGSQNLKSIASNLFTMHNRSWTSVIKRFVYAFYITYHKSKLVDVVEEYARETRPYEINKGTASNLMQKYLSAIEGENSVAQLRILRTDIENDFSQIERNGTQAPLRIQLVGESYCVIEPFINFNVIEYLGNNGVLVKPFLTSHRWLYYHSIRKDEDKDFSKKRAKKLAQQYWAYGTGGEDQVSIGYTLHAAHEAYDGIIHLMPFCCMPETAALPAFESISKKHDIPFLNISLDEHTGTEGLYTRVEAFLDLLQWRRKKNLYVRR